MHVVGKQLGGDRKKVDENEEVRESGFNWVTAGSFTGKPEKQTERRESEGVQSEILLEILEFLERHLGGR